MKKSFDDHAEEALAFIHGQPEKNIDAIHDELRDQITALGWEVKDTPKGPQFVKK